MIGHSFKVLFLATIGVALGVFFFLLLFTIGEGSPITAKLITAHGHFIDSRADSSVVMACESTAAASVALSRDELLSSTISFYESVITVLVASIGALGIVAFMYIKGVSLERIDRDMKEIRGSVVDLIDKNVAIKISDESFHRLLREYSGAATKDVVEDFRKLEAGVHQYYKDFDRENPIDRVEHLEEKVLAIERELSKRDMADSDVGDGSVKVPNGGA